MLVETSDKNCSGWVGLAFFYPIQLSVLARRFFNCAPRKKTSPFFVVMMSADVKNALPVLYSYMGRKSRAGPLQLNGAKNAGPTHPEQFLSEVSTSMALSAPSNPN